jgi:hypothetical protein
MESLGGDRSWSDRFVAEHAAVFYYWGACPALPVLHFPTPPLTWARRRRSLFVAPLLTVTVILIANAGTHTCTTHANACKRMQRMHACTTHTCTAVQFGSRVVLVVSLYACSQHSLTCLPVPISLCPRAVLLAFYFVSPKMAYNFMQRVELHAADTYSEPGRGGPACYR